MAQYLDLHRDDLELLAYLFTDANEWRAVVRADPLFVGEVMNDLSSRQVRGKRLAARLAPTLNSNVRIRYGLLFFFGTLSLEVIRFGFIEQAELARRPSLTARAELLLFLETDELFEDLDVAFVFMVPSLVLFVLLFVRFDRAVAIEHHALQYFNVS